MCGLRFRRDCGNYVQLKAVAWRINRRFRMDVNRIWRRLADACQVCMIEEDYGDRMFTFDALFQIYRDRLVARLLAVKRGSLRADSFLRLVLPARPSSRRTPGPHFPSHSMLDSLYTMQILCLYEKMHGVKRKLQSQILDLACFLNSAG